MDKFSSKSTTKSRERPPERRLYRTEGNTIFYSQEVAKKLKEALEILLEQIKEEER